jgi:5-(carboxyamino)imidazole ribonucleotide synthase
MTTLGIVGSGQLGRMLVLSALPLGVRCRVLALGDDAAVRDFAHCHAPIGDAAAEAAFAADVAAITTEIENIDGALLERLAAHAPVWPPRQALSCKRDRRAERELLSSLSLPQPDWTATRVPPGGADDATRVRAELRAAVERVGLPARVKVAVGGYDGRGQWRVAAPADLDRVDAAAAPFVVEAEVPFDAEFSLVGAFAGAGAPPRFWTPGINRHASGILWRCDVGDGRVDAATVARGSAIVTTLGHALDYRGVLAVELYRVGGDVLVNEFAPRVHNSGHWTLDAAASSQFENHVRAVLGWPLAATTLRAPCVSWNVIGAWPARERLLAVEDLHLHEYGKSARPGRKLGHVTLCGAAGGDPRIDHVEALLLAARRLT